MTFDYDVIVVGSGFGGSVSALRLTEKGYRVGVFEAGRRFADDEFPQTSWRIRRYLWAPALGCYGIQRMTLLKDTFVLAGAGVGGGSLVYANTLYEPPDTFFADGQWAHITDWKAELAAHYDQAKRMLDVPDPFFGGAGPNRRACTHCGECMTGCRHNAKNTLVKNYLYLAEQAGATVHPLTTVTDVRPLPDSGYQVTTVRTGPWMRKRRHRFTAEQVVFAAAALGTQRLLHRLRDRGSLPDLSARLGYLPGPIPRSCWRFAAETSPATSPRASRSPPPSTRIRTRTWNRSSNTRPNAVVHPTPACSPGS